MAFRSGILPLPLVLCPLLGSCQQFEAHERTTLDIAARELRTLVCTTHNGAVQVRGREGVDLVHVVAGKTGRGASPEEARQVLAAIEIRHGMDGDGTLRLGWGWRDGEDDRGRSASVAFTIDTPPQVAARIETHNGRVRVTGLRGAVAASTHNGSISLDGEHEKVSLSTHNGSITAVLRGAGAVEGDLTTHNGRIALGVEEGCRTEVTASTHNGSLAAQEPFSVLERDGDGLRARLGEGGGALRLVTHNGSVVLGSAGGR